MNVYLLCPASGAPFTTQAWSDHPTFGGSPHREPLPAGALPWFSGNLLGLSRRGLIPVLLGEQRNSGPGYSSVRIQGPRRNPLDIPCLKGWGISPLCLQRGPSLPLLLAYSKPSTPQTEGSSDWRLWPCQLPGHTYEGEGLLSFPLPLHPPDLHSQHNWQQQLIQGNLHMLQTHLQPFSDNGWLSTTLLLSSFRFIPYSRRSSCRLDLQVKYVTTCLIESNNSIYEWWFNKDSSP